MSDVTTDVLAGWTPGSFTAAGMTFPTFRRGEGPAVIVVHEIPGITPTVAQFATDVVDAGMTVVMPSLTGTPGRAPSLPYTMRVFGQVCIRREFETWATRRTSPIIAWLRALATHLHQEVGGPGVGAVGMCFSGGFALGMMVDEVMVAPVLSQPSMPFPLGAARGADLNLSPDDEVVVAHRAQAGCDVLGLRFRDDRAVGTRFESLRRLLGDRFIAIELPSARSSDHSVLTEQRDEASVRRVIAFLQERLLPG
jgi:dienelactone hydrolase